MQEFNTELTAEELEQRKKLIGTLLNYRCIKLVSGEEILCQILICIDTPDVILARHPMKVLTHLGESPEDVMYAFVPFNAFTDQEIVPIMKSSVVYVTSITAAAQESYLQSVIAYSGRDLVVLGGNGGEPTDSQNPTSTDSGDENDEEDVDKTKKGWVN